MALLTWSDQYLIGNESIDRQHEELFRLINAFHSRWLETHNQQDIARMLNRLVTYAEMHFRNEEAIMDSEGFALLGEHQQIHEALIDRIFALQKSYEDESLRVEMETMKFVKSWLIEHILEDDYRFRDFMKRKQSLAKAALQ